MVFMDLMNIVSKLVLDKYIILFIDDVLVYSKILAEHVIHLTHDLETLQQNKLYAKFSKCKFLLDRVAFQGHIISDDRISVDPSKVEALVAWNRPANVSEVQNFLGFITLLC